jgi:hypothetical protein
MTICARLFPLLPALWLAACSGAGDGGAAPPVAAAPDPVAGGAVKSGDWFDDDRDKITKKYGAMNPKMTADGQVAAGPGQEFTGFKRDNPEFKGRWEGKEYQAGDFRKKSWWGDKDYVKKVYGGNTDAGALRKESRLGGKRAGEAGVGARDAGKSYATGGYDTGRAREEGGPGIGRPSDAETDGRREVFSDPDVIPWQEQNGMSVEDTRRALGR